MRKPSIGERLKKRPNSFLCYEHEVPLVFKTAEELFHHEEQAHKEGGEEWLT